MLRTYVVAAALVAAASGAFAQDQAVPRGERPRGDNPPVGTAVPRGEVRRQPGPQRVEPPIVHRAPPPPANRVYTSPRVTNNFYYYPRRYYPYGYGTFGLGYFYYDPFSWYPNSYGASAWYGAGGVYPYSGYFPGRASYNAAFDIGELRLQVSPRTAQVYVDGCYAGQVDDFDGIVQSLKLESGPYHVEVVEPGYETLEFDIRITPGQKINYRGVLRPRP